MAAGCVKVICTGSATTPSVAASLNLGTAPAATVAIALCRAAHAAREFDTFRVMGRRVYPGIVGILYLCS